MASLLRSRTPQVPAQTLAQQAVPGAGRPDGERSSRSEWCSSGNRGTTFSGRQGMTPWLSPGGALRIGPQQRGLASRRTISRSRENTIADERHIHDLRRTADHLGGPTSARSLP